MPRRPRASTGGVVYHVLNRGAGRMTIFNKPGDYEAFERIVIETHDRVRCRVLGYCLMPNHWHLILWPRKDGDLSEFMRLLTVTHAQRWHAHRHTAGTGPVYQGRFKSFPVQSDEHLLTVARYVERNALHAGLVDRAEDWRWCSLWQRRNTKSENRVPLSPWPVDVPLNWLRMVNRSQADEVVGAIKRSIKRGSPFGDPRWQARTAQRLQIEHSMRPLGRPKKNPKD